MLMLELCVGVNMYVDEEEGGEIVVDGGVVEVEGMGVMPQLSPFDPLLLNALAVVSAAE